MNFDKELYFIEQRHVKLLHEIMRKMYGDGTHLKPDDRRDMANQLHAILSCLEDQELKDHLC